MQKTALLSLMMLGAMSSISHAAISDKVAKDAYLYGYSIDEAYKYFYKTTVATNTPLNRFQNIRYLADDTYTAHPSINNDTLHLMGWLDVGAEPVIVSIPDFDQDRYWILHTMDMGHYTTAMIGARTRGTKGGRFMFASKSWKGTVPDSVDEVIYVDSDLQKMMGRIMATNKEDEKKALNYMDQWNIRTLSEYLGVAGPEQKVRTYLDPAKTSWLERVNFMLCEGTMAEADKKWVSQYKAMGIAPCNYKLTQEQLAAAQVGEKLGMQHLKDLVPKLSHSRNLLGTREQLNDGARDLFDMGTYIGQWGLPADETVYLKADVGSDGQKINGANGKKYQMRFKAPEVSQFWSYTVYGSDNRLMAHNELNRHSRGDRTLKPDADGMYTIELSSDVKANTNNPNFLPIPNKDSYIILRMYGASKDVQNGKYQMQTVQVVN
jgi:hypothetical protein